MHCSRKHQNILQIKRKNLLCRLVLELSNATSYVYAYIMLSTHGRNRSPTVWVPYAQEICWCHFEVIARAVNLVLKHCNFGFGRYHLDLLVPSLFNPSKRKRTCQSHRRRHTRGFNVCFQKCSVMEESSALLSLLELLIFSLVMTLSLCTAFVKVILFRCRLHEWKISARRKR